MSGSQADQGSSPGSGPNGLWNPDLHLKIGRGVQERATVKMSLEWPWVWVVLCDENARAPETVPEVPGACPGCLLISGLCAGSPLLAVKAHTPPTLKPPNIPSSGFGYRIHGKKGQLLGNLSGATWLGTGFELVRSWALARTDHVPTAGGNAVGGPLCADGGEWQRSQCGETLGRAHTPQASSGHQQQSSFSPA